MDVALWEALPPAERAKIEAEKKAEEEKRTAEQAAWQTYVASERVRQLALWQKARARAVRLAEDARAKALSAVGPKHHIYAWRYVDRVHVPPSVDEALGPDCTQGIDTGVLCHPHGPRTSLLPKNQLLDSLSDAT